MAIDLIDENLQETNETPKETNSKQEKIDFPYARSVYIKGILAIILTLSIFGFIYGLYCLNIALKRSSESLRDHKNHPEKYKKSSLKKVKLGRNMAYIALVIWIGEIIAFLAIYN